MADEIWYEVRFRSGQIEKVKVTKKSRTKVWVERGYQFVKPYPKADNYGGFFESFDAARKAAVEHQLDRLAEAQRTVNDAGQRATRLGNLQESNVTGPFHFEPFDFTNIKL